MASSSFLTFILLIGLFKLIESSELEIEELSWLNDDKDEDINIVQSCHDSLRKCDFTSGKWVYDQTYPLYDAVTCLYLSTSVTCRKNRRLDSGYEKWRWKPHGCNIPRFDVLEFLGRMRRKRTMLVGDSIMRNQWESPVCLVESVLPTDRKTVTYAGPTMAFYALVRPVVVKKVICTTKKLCYSKICMLYVVPVGAQWYLQTFKIEFYAAKI